jgi:hypothetical protein
VEHLAHRIDADHRQFVRIEQPDLHQKRGLIPVDMSMCDLADAEGDNADQCHLA